MGSIHNFSITAHIDHGKPILAGRIIQLCDGLPSREMETQVLDSMGIEKERSITTKAQTATLSYKAQDSKVYSLSLIDTPGHVGFSYEVSRSLFACEGTLLVVDASQGVETQAVTNCYTIIGLGMEVMPVLNKIDLSAADPGNTVQKIEDIIGIDATDATRCSTKIDVGVANVLGALIARVSMPRSDPAAPLQVLIIDSWFDDYIGVVVLVRVMNGTLHVKGRILLMAAGARHLMKQVGVLSPKSAPRKSLLTGQVGFVIAGIKELKAAKVSDTITHMAPRKADAPLPDFKEVKPQVFAGLYPVEANQYEVLRESLEELKLNDVSLQYEPEVSQALGFGFHCGFLGLLHMKIAQERLEREFGIDLITTAPTVVYQVQLRDDTMVQIENPIEMSAGPNKIEAILEPIVTVNLYVPQEYVGAVVTLCEQKHSSQVNMSYHGHQVQLAYEVPMGETMLDFFDQLKPASRDYTSIDYEFKEYRVSDVVKVDILINSDKVDTLSIIVHRSSSTYRGREVAVKMCEIIPRRMRDVAIQAVTGANVTVRENVKALRKNALARYYSGDISRKKKLLEKQKEGRKRMKQVDTVKIPQGAFLAILRVEEK